MAPQRTEAELHKRKEGTEASERLGLRGDKALTQREMLQKGIRGIREDKEGKGDKGG